MSVEFPTYVLAQELARALEVAGVEYAVGGSIALAYAAEPRATKDVDVNLFMSPDEAEGALEALRGAGVVFDDATLRAAHERFDAMGFVRGVRVDLFFDSIPLHASARARRVRVDLLGTPVWVLSAEDLTVLKMMFNRDKDWVDIGAMLADRGAAFDREYVQDQVVAHLGADDERLARFLRMCEGIDAAAP